ncbi:MAG: lysine--tRNA ligase, partial [Planktothrix sp.]
MATNETRNEVEVRFQKVNELRELGIEPYPSHSVERSHTTQEIKDLFAQPEKTLNDGESDPDAIPLKVCGRITFKRDSGSIGFIGLTDIAGTIQLKLEKKIVTGETGLSFNQVKKYLDLGDFIAADGIGCRTNRGELSVQVERIFIVSKATMPFPDSYYGINDPELCRRNREIDLVSNPKSLETFKARNRIIKKIRTYLWDNSFEELETPVLQAIYGGAAARPFVTHHNALDINLYLRIATELHLKRAICGGFERVFEIGRVFRNEGIDSTHNPEFTSIELYQAYADYFDLMTLIEDLICAVATDLFGDNMEFDYQGDGISLERKYDYSEQYPSFTGTHWKVQTMVEAVREKTGLDFDTLDLSEALKAAETLGLNLSKLEIQSLGYVLYAVFDKLVSSELLQPTFITEFP